MNVIILPRVLSASSPPLPPLSY